MFLMRISCWVYVPESENELNYDIEKTRLVSADTQVQATTRINEWLHDWFEHNKRHSDDVLILDSVNVKNLTI